MLVRAYKSYCPDLTRATFAALFRTAGDEEGTTMPKTRGTGLLMAWTDVDPAHEDEFNRWHNEEHIGRLLTVPGFLSAGRYRALRGEAEISRDV